jgi:predicted DNA-binding transcriptional regulator AlpA
MDTSRDQFRLIRKKALADRLNVTTRTVDRWRRAGKLPREIRLSEKTSAWRLDEIEAWMEQRRVS